MTHIIVYFPYALKKNPKSGSGVRPKLIVDAFREYGEKKQIEVILISGNSSERQERIEDYKNKYNAENALFCYMENSTVPFWLTEKDHMPRKPFMDAAFWKYLKQANVPIGCFYRDVYWQFDDMYVPPKNIKMLTPIMRSIYQRELKVYSKYVDILYLPSLEMNEYVGWKGTFDELPPGMQQLDKEKATPTSPPKAVFVGGISDQIGIIMMLEAFKSLNEEDTYLLELVCREEEYRQYPEMHKYNEYDWLTISHKSGRELDEVYQNAAIALIPRERNEYHDFSVPVKMFEYLSNGLPIVATDCKAHARILEKDGLGIVTEVDAKKFAEGVLHALESSTYEKLKTNIENYAYEHHSWSSRVEKIATQLISKRNDARK